MSDSKVRITDPFDGYSYDAARELMESVLLIPLRKDPVMKSTPNPHNPYFAWWNRKVKEAKQDK